MDQNKIGNFLKELRKEKGLTQEEEANIFNVTRRTITRWESGYNMPDLSLLTEIADYYNVDLRELFDGERKKENENENIKETFKKAAEYNSIENTKAKKVVLIYLVIGIVAFVVNQILMLTVERETFLSGLIVGITAGLAFVSQLFALKFILGKFKK